MIIPFDELRKTKDLLPHGSIERIANELGIEVQAVRNYFGATDFTHGGFVGVHYEPGTNSGVVMLEDDSIYECALRIIEELQGHAHEVSY